MITTQEFYTARGGEDRVRRRLSGTSVEQDSRIAEVILQATVEARSRVAPALGSKGRERAAALDETNTPKVLKDQVAAYAWYLLLRALSDQMPEDLRLLKVDFEEFFRRLHAGQVDLGLDPEQPADRRRPAILFRKNPFKSRRIDPFEVP